MYFNATPIFNPAKEDQAFTVKRHNQHCFLCWLLLLHFGWSGLFCSDPLVCCSFGLWLPHPKPWFVSCDNMRRGSTEPETLQSLPCTLDTQLPLLFCEQMGDPLCGSLAHFQLLQQSFVHSTVTQMDLLGDLSTCHSLVPGHNVLDLLELVCIHLAWTLVPHFVLQRSSCICQETPIPSVDLRPWQAHGTMDSVQVSVCIHSRQSKMLAKLDFCSLILLDFCHSGGHYEICLTVRRNQHVTGILCRCIDHAQSTLCAHVVQCVGITYSVCSTTKSDWWIQRNWSRRIMRCTNLVHLEDLYLPEYNSFFPST